MSESSARLQTWLRRLSPVGDAMSSLVCLPHAGGSARFFFPLARALAPAIGDVLAHLRRLGAPGSTSLDDPEIRAMVLPLIHNDYRSVETYRHDPSAVLDCPITVLTGDRDALVSPNEAHAWTEHTTGPTDLVVLRGGHFYLTGQNERVLLRRRLPAIIVDETPHPR